MECGEFRTKVFDCIDLTGDAAIIGTKTVVDKIPVLCVDESQEKNNNASICEICLEEKSRYTCPGCQMKTCCLACVQSHKKKTGCIGKRDKTTFVARNEFNNVHLLDDYRFLEDVSRIADNARRDFRSKPSSHSSGKKATMLGRAAARSGVKLFRMQVGMKKWKENRSMMHFKEKIIYWTVKLKFADCGRELINNKVAETVTLKSVLAPIVESEMASPEDRLKFVRYISRKENERVRVFFQHEYTPGYGNVRFTEVNADRSLKEVLVSKSVVEYPTFVVVVDELTADSIRQEKFVSERARVTLEDVRPVSERASLDSSSSCSSSDDSSSDSDIDDTRPPASKKRRSSEGP